MKLSDFDYKLPKDLIVVKPQEPRDHSRLLLLNKKTGKIIHKYFYNIIDYLKQGDVLVLNNSKVFSARLIGQKETKGRVEVFLHQKISNLPASSSLDNKEKNIEAWNCILGGRVKEGLIIKFDENLEGSIFKKNNDGTWEIEFNLIGDDFMKVVDKIGQVPIPPYIQKQRKNSKSYFSDYSSYQTVYADEKKIGSVAAPTAGLHFAPDLINKIKSMGVQIEYITLHVGLGTFAPVKNNNIKKHKMHSEFVEIKKEVVQRILKAKKEKRRIIAVGTTSVRTLEGVISSQMKTKKISVPEYQFPINLFIYLGYKFKVIDAMITNFHLPKSTLLMLVSALAGKKNIDKAYCEAIKQKYRFYSYGDAMLIF